MPETYSWGFPTKQKLIPQQRLIILTNPQKKRLVEGVRLIASYELGSAKLRRSFNQLDPMTTIQVVRPPVYLKLSMLEASGFTSNAKQMDVSENRGTPKWMVYNDGKPY